MCIRIGERHFSFAITDAKASQIHSLGYFTQPEMTAESLAKVYSDLPELRNGFQEVQVSYDHPASVLVPLSFYDADAAKTILRTMYGNIIGSSVISEPIDAWKLYNIYAVPNEVHDWVSRVYPVHKYRHNYTLSMGMIMNAPEDHILIDFSTHDFSLLLVKGGKLIVAQTMSYSSPEDILYYLLKACNQFSLSRDEIKLYISGLIEKESQLFRELYQYFLHTEFREPVWQTTETKKYPSHFFTSLNDLARCVS